MMTIPGTNLLNENLSLTNRYRMMTKRVQSFWLSWQNDYLKLLQQRSKWFQTQQNIKIGDVVLIKNEKLPPAKWLMGRIIILIQVLII